MRGPLFWEEVEALLCEGKDALLSSQGVRRREWPGRHYPAPDLSAMPLMSNRSSGMCLLDVDLSAVAELDPAVQKASWEVAKDAFADGS